MLMVIPPTDIQILFTNYDIITYFLNLAFCSEHFIIIKHRILATFNINKKNQFWQPKSDPGQIITSQIGPSQFGPRSKQSQNESQIGHIFQIE